MVDISKNEWRPSKKDAGCNDNWHDAEEGKNPGDESQCPTCKLIETIGNGWASYTSGKPFTSGKRYEHKERKYDN